MRKYKVLVYHTDNGWAWSRVAEALKKYAPDDFLVEVFGGGETPEHDLAMLEFPDNDAIGKLNGVVVQRRGVVVYRHGMGADHEVGRIDTARCRNYHVIVNNLEVASWCLAS